MRQRSAPGSMGIRCRVLYVLALTALSGCQPHEPAGHSPGRLAALAGYLAFAPPATAFTAPPPLSAALQLSIPASSLDNLDFLLLSGCAVQATIIKRDSILGRAAKPSQRLLLALEFLPLAPACIQHLQGQRKAPLASRLEAAWQEHRAQLPALIFNATLGSDEYRAFWLTQQAPANYPHSTGVTASAALRSIDADAQRWLSGDYRAENLTFELQLSEIAGGGGGARLQALSQRSDARSMRRYRTDLKFLTALERQLAAVLPPGYSAWQRHRVMMNANAAHPVSQHSGQRLQRHTAQDLSSSPTVEEIGYTATLTAIRHTASEE